MFALPNVSVVVVGRPHYTYLTVADLMMKQPRSLIMITFVVNLSCYSARCGIFASRNIDYPSYVQVNASCNTWRIIVMVASNHNLSMHYVTIVCDSLTFL